MIDLEPIDAGSGTNLGSIRRQLVEDTGRTDLVVNAEEGDYTDVSANRKIRAAQQWLDSRFPNTKDKAWLYKVLTAGQSLVSFQNARVIEQVWIASDSIERRKLEKITPEELRLGYRASTLAALDRGAPAYWSPNISALAPEQIAETAESLSEDGITDTDLLLFGTHFPHRTIVVMPPADATYTLEVLCRWYSHPLINDSDVSFWSVQHPELLLRATALQLEMGQRNSQGTNDYEGPLLRDLQAIFFDMVSEEWSGPSRYFVKEPI